MTGGGGAGKGGSQSETNQTAQNQQTAVQSGIGLGAYSSGNSISIQSGDVEVAKKGLDTAAFLGKTATDAATDQLKISTQGILTGAEFSMLGANDLAKKFADSVSTTQIANTQLLQSVSDSQNQANIRAAQLQSQAQEGTFDVLKMASPQSTGYQTETTTKYYLYAILAAGLVIVAFFIYGKRK
jgi:hypothetical protein